MPVLTIGRLANLGGVRVDTVRFYERKGLLPAPSRSAAGYRSYTPKHVERLKFIVKAKALGFKLDEIVELLKLGAGTVNRSSNQALAAKRAADLDQKIRELSVIRDVLQTYADRNSPHEDLIGALVSRAAR